MNCHDWAICGLLQIPFVLNSVKFSYSNYRRRISHTSATAAHAERSPIGNAHGRHTRAASPSYSSHKWSFQTCKTTWLWGAWCLQCLHTHSILTKTKNWTCQYVLNGHEPLASPKWAPTITHHSLPWVHFFFLLSTIVQILCILCLFYWQLAVHILYVVNSFNITYFCELNSTI